MSLENLKEYARRCATEPALRDRAKEFGLANVEEHMRQAGGMGLAWTEDDMIAFRKEMVDSHGEIGDLSEEELEQVAGGVVSATGAAVAAAAAAGVAVVVGGVAAGAAAGTATASSGGGW